MIKSVASSASEEKKPSPLVGLGFESKRDGLGFAAADGDVLGLLAVGLMPRRDGVFARGQVPEGEATTIVSYSVVGVLQHCESAVHPGMHIAFHGNEFRLVVLFADRGRSRWLRLVPFAVQLRQWMDVVRGLILILNLQFLVHLKSQQVRNIPAAFLSEDRGRTGGGLIRRA